MTFQLIASAGNLRNLYDRDGNWDSFELDKVFEASSIEKAVEIAQQILGKEGFKLGPGEHAETNGSMVDMTSFEAKLRKFEVVAEFSYQPANPGHPAQRQKTIPAQSSIPPKPAAIDVKTPQ